MIAWRWHLRRVKALIAGDRQRCSRRDEGYGYQEKFSTVDWWNRGIWGTAVGRAIADWWHNGWVGTKLRALQHWLFEKRWHWLRNHLPNPSSGGTVWRWSWQPRTCSFCGGVHQDDAARLIAEGWLSTGSTKGYKHYMEPPRGAHWSPVPPVKLYVQHFTPEQIKQFNAALDSAAKR